MNKLQQLARRLGLQILGPAEQTPKTDPLKQMDREEGVSQPTESPKPAEEVDLREQSAADAEREPRNGP